MHILLHYKGNSISALCKYLKTFLSKHIKWVASVGHDVLSKKCLAVEDYANDLSEGEIPLDPLGLLYIARNWHIHICVFLKNGIWTTRCDNTLENVSIYLLNTGGFTFFDTCIHLPLRLSILPQSDEENSTLDLEDVLMKSSMDTVGTKDTSFATNTADVGIKILHLLVLTLVQSLPLPPGVQRGVVMATNVKSVLPALAQDQRKGVL